MVMKTNNCTRHGREILSNQYPSQQCYISPPAAFQQYLLLVARHLPAVSQILKKCDYKYYFLSISFFDC